FPAWDMAALTDAMMARGGLAAMRISAVRSCLVSCVTVSVCAVGLDVAAQQKAALPARTLALEIRWSNDTKNYYRVSETLRQRILARSEKTGEGFLSTSETVLESAAEGDAVRIDLSVHLYPRGRPGELHGDVKKVGTHLLRLNQSIPINEFAEYDRTYTV